MKRLALAFSGGLDTSWLVPLFVDQGWTVTTVTVDVGGFAPDAARTMADLSARLGSAGHVHVAAKGQFFEEVVRYLIAGNVLRGGTYPLCVGAERALQARLVAEEARRIGANAIAHGSTAAGNDQVRFEVALRSYAPGIDVLAPVRDEGPSRERQIADLEARGLPVPSHGAAYSVNSGLWGVTIGGVETRSTTGSIPESQWVRTKGAFERALEPCRVVVGFDRGVPSSLDGEPLGPVDLIERLDGLAASYGIGRGVHLGETILGIKGRVAFEAPGAVVLLAAHRELEKLTLTKRQQSVKDGVAAVYGDLVHEGLFTDPACRDIEALLARSQERVRGEVTVLLRTGGFFIEGVSSPWSLHAASRAVYGEAALEWSAADAKGFARLYGLSTELHGRLGAP